MIFSPVVERWLLKRHPRQAPRASEATCRRLYVDLSVIAKSDAWTGIQRVVRSISEHLPNACSSSVTILPIVVRKRRDGYQTVTGDRMVGASDSIFFALDFATDSIFRYRRELEALSAQGLRIWVVVHDILPISHPHWFTAASCVKYRRWMRVCARLADGFICVSNDVSEQLYTLLQQRFGLSELPAIVTIDPGSDISDVSLPVDGSQLPKASGLTPEKFAQSAIVVGTLEPRKGHADVLDAFELIWSGQILPGTAEIPLILIGKQGWNTKALTDRIRAHPQAGILLFWFDAVNDVGLRSAYDACRLVIVPSHAEGYGLPLDEALSMGVPVLARDIPVFRRHDGHQIMRFSAESSATELARAIVACHSKDRQSYPQLAVTHWDKTACQVVRALGIKSSDTNVH